MCAQRKAGRRQRARLRLSSVSSPWSLAVHHQSLAHTLRKTERLRRRLVEWYLLAGRCSLYTADSIKVTLGIGDWATRICLAIRSTHYSYSECPKQPLVNQLYTLLAYLNASLPTLWILKKCSQTPLAWVFSVRVNIERTVNVCRIYPTVFELKEGKSIRLSWLYFVFN